MQSELEDLHANLRVVENAQLDARRTIQGLHQQVSALEGERCKLSQDVSELQSRLAHEEDKAEESRKETFVLKQKVCAIIIIVI